MNYLVDINLLNRRGLVRYIFTSSYTHVFWRYHFAGAHGVSETTLRMDYA